MDQVARGGRGLSHRDARERTAPVGHALLAEGVPFDGRVHPRAGQPGEAANRGEPEPVLAQAVPAEHLVPAVPAEEDRGARARLADQEPGGERGPVPDRLRERGEDRHERLEPLFGRDSQVAPDRSVRPFRQRRSGGVPVEDRPEGERLDIRSAERESRPDRVAVDPVGQQQRDGNVADQAAPRRLDEQRPELLDELLAAAPDGRFARARSARVVPARHRDAVPAGREQVPGRELEDAPDDRPGADDVAQRQVLEKRGRVERAGHPGGPEERRDARGEGEGPAGMVVEERLLAEAVPREPETLLVAIVDRERELPDQPVEGRGTPPLPGPEKDLRVGARPEFAGAQPQLGAQVLEVVDLAVVADGVAATGGAHRLAARLAQVEDREAAVPERRLALALEPLPVGPAPPERLEHGGDQGGVVLGLPKPENPGDAAHGR